MLKLENIVKGYNGETVLKGISFEIEDGAFISVKGRSGSGKSTMLSILGGFLEPDSGRVLWDGKDISSFSDKEMSWMRSNYIGFVFQSFKLIPTLSVEDNIMLPASLSDRKREDSEKDMKFYAKKLNIDKLMNKFPNQLSGGQCQRAAICRAISFAPSVVILDEPTAALDSENEALVMELFAEINKKRGVSVIQVTHSDKVASYAKKIIHLTDGVLG